MAGHEPAAGTDSDIEYELERTTRLRGFRYGIHEFLAAVDLDGLRRTNDRMEREYTNKESSLIDRKTMELLIIAANVAQGDVVSHLQIHLHAATRAGATEDELLEVLTFLMPWISLPRYAIGLEAWRGLFRPDLPTIDRVAELR